MNILQKLVDAQLQLQSTQRNWDEECLFKCDDLLGEVIRQLEAAQPSVQADEAFCGCFMADVSLTLVDGKCSQCGKPSRS